MAERHDDKLDAAVEIVRKAAEPYDTPAAYGDDQFIVDLLTGIADEIAALKSAPSAEGRIYPGLWNDARLGQECESLVALKTHFTGEPPYVGNEGVLLALREALDELNRLRAPQSANGAFLTDVCDELFGSFLESAGFVGNTYGYRCQLCERIIDIKERVHADHEPGCIIPRVREYLKVHRPTSVPPQSAATDRRAK